MIGSNDLLTIIAQWIVLAVYTGATVAGLIIAWRNRDAFCNITIEKSAILDASEGDVNAPASFSRLAGLIGMAFLIAFCWGLGFYILSTIWSRPQDVKTVVADVGNFILAGAALFMPYAFNQLSQILGPRRPVAPFPPPPPRT